MDVNFLEPQFPYQGAYKKRMLIIIVACMLFGGALAAAAWGGGKLFGTEDQQTPSDELAEIGPPTVWGRVKSLFTSSNRPLKGYDDDRVNIALFGIGGTGHEGSQLTDTILLATIKPSTKQIALISVPRDTAVAAPSGYGYQKINEINAYAEMERPDSGTATATRALEQFLGVTIPYFVRIDFRGFEKAIDDIGGVDVYVDRSFTDYEFPNNTFGYRTISFVKGWQRMDGSTALNFARSRHGNNFEGSDFARARRQQKVIVAVRDKVLSGSSVIHPTRFANLLETLDTHVNTNMQFNDLLELYNLMRNLNSDSITSIVFSDDPSSVLYADDAFGGFYLRPKDPTLTQIHTTVQNIFNEDTAHAVQGVIEQYPLKPKPKSTARIELHNGTWRPGFAARQKNRLEADEYTVVSIGNAAIRPTPRAQIFATNDKHRALVEKLKKRYDADEIPNRPPPSPDQYETSISSSDIIIVLGENVPDFAE